MELKRPLLIGGLGLSGSLWLLDTLAHSTANGTALLGAIAIGSGVWWWRQRTGSELTQTAQTAPVNRDQVVQKLERVAQTIALWKQEASTLEASQAEVQTQAIEMAEQQRQQLLAGSDRQSLVIGITGEQATGKTALVKHLQASWSAPQPYQIDFQEFALPDLASENHASVESDTQGLQDVTDQETDQDLNRADLVLFLTAGDLTDSDFQQLQKLAQQGQRFILGLGKQDRLPPLERAVILPQLKARLAQLHNDGVESPAAVGFAAAPSPIKRRRHHSDGTLEESQTQPEPDTADLQIALTQTVQRAAARLVLETTLRQGEQLRRTVQTQVNQLKRDRALPIITQYQWLTGAAAFANPVPTLDLLATAAINGQLIVDLGEVYDCKFSLEQGKTAAATLAGLVVKLGLVELSTEALSALLKSNGITYIAGGLVQGISAAYLTRLAGLGLADWFEAQTLADAPQAEVTLSMDAVAQRLKDLLDQRGSVLPKLVQQGLKRWQAQPSAGNPPLSTADPSVTLAATAES
ncbi:MAG: DUF697 domain-containing protein [Cyanobacteria bacterium P01_H01_bin.119]